MSVIEAFHDLCCFLREGGLNPPAQRNDPPAKRPHQPNPNRPYRPMTTRLKANPCPCGNTKLRKGLLDHLSYGVYCPECTRYALAKTDFDSFSFHRAFHEALRKGVRMWNAGEVLQVRQPATTMRTRP
jgi:hypothetical protein